MSEDEIRVGKLIPLMMESTLEKTAFKILNAVNTGIKDIMDDPLEHLRINCSDEYFIDFENKKIYKIDSENEYDNEDIYYAKENDDSSINYVLKYHNGGCCFEEAMEYAIKKMKMESN